MVLKAMSRTRRHSRRFENHSTESRFLFMLFTFACFANECYGKCTLDEHSLDEQTKKHENELLKRIEPLTKLPLTTSDDSYNYSIVICDQVKGQVEGSGAVQVNKSNPKDSHMLGKYTQIDIMGGTNWILLTYLNGSAYHSHCSNASRQVQIMIICDPDKLQGDFSMLEEKRRSTSSECSYWFELSSRLACNAMGKVVEPTKPPGVSSGGVFCIIFFTVLSLYLVLGVLYKRIIIGSQGLEQIPNYSFWRAFGNLQADACDYVCRCGPRHEAQAYRGIDDHLKTEEHDDQLLNM